MLDHGRAAQPSNVSNRLLAALPPAELELLWPHFEQVELPLGTVLVVLNATVVSAFFVQTGTVSMVAGLKDGSRIEVGMVGPEGMVGLPLLLGSKTSSLEGLVQVRGTALRLPENAFRKALETLPTLQPLLLRYLDAFLLQLAQSAACNGRHAIQQRLARWLLMEHDRSRGDRLDMTQEFLSVMLGVQRPGVTVAISALRRAGLVKLGRGTLEVLDRAGLEAVSCECYEVVRRRYAWLVDS